MYRQVALPSLEGGGELHGALGSEQQQHLQGSSLSLTITKYHYKIISILQSKHAQILAFKLFQENRKNQRKLCRDSCLQNIIKFGPINNDKIREATVHGRIVFYLPKKIRLNSERKLFTLGML